MKIEVSNGEILDKISILSIKLRKITDLGKIANVMAEHKILQTHFDELLITNELHELYIRLYAVNMQLWEVEDSLREMERRQDFGPAFVDLARSVYILNDRRASIKKELNILTNSTLIEEKSYADYENTN